MGFVGLVTNFLCVEKGYALPSLAKNFFIPIWRKEANFCIKKPIEFQNFSEKFSKTQNLSPVLVNSDGNQPENCLKTVTKNSQTKIISFPQ